MNYASKIAALFQNTFSASPQLVVRAPGRINLIGEHTDYNGGFVLPGSVNKGVYFAISNREDDTCELVSENFNDSYSFKISELQKSEKSWANYLIGAVQQITKQHNIKGFNLVFGGDIPAGAGMSSSAALESGLLYALNELNGLQISKIELVKMAQRVENEFVGLNCGIMDMFASIMGKKNAVIQLDCRSLDYFYFSFQPEDISIVLCNSGVKHSLAESAYNTRRQECEQGVAILKNYYPTIGSLREVSFEDLEKHKNEFPENVYKRCRYVVLEIDRVMAACEDLERSDFVAFGKKMYETHAGLSQDYEVSCEELDFLVDITAPHTRPEENIKQKGVVGSRLMGGGFGGCTINLVKKESVEEFKNYVRKAYFERFNIELEIYEVELTDGIEIVNQTMPP